MLRRNGVLGELNLRQASKAMVIQTRICRNFGDRDWNLLLEGALVGSPFQSQTWFKSLEKTFDYQCLYIVASTSGGKIMAALPLMEIRQRWGICRYYSGLPMGVYGSVIEGMGCNGEIIQAILSRFLELVNSCVCVGASLVDYAGNCSTISSYASKTFNRFTHILNLERPMSEIYDGYDYSIKKNLKKAAREKIKIKDAETIGEVDAYYDMANEIVLKYKRAPYSREFFQNIFKIMVPAGEAKFTLAFREGQPIAGSIQVARCGCVYNWLTASKRQMLEYRAVEAVDDAIIRWAVEQRFRVYDFGASPPEATGLIKFKEKWGCQKREYKQYEFVGGYKIPAIIKRFKAALSFSKNE